MRVRHCDLRGPAGRTWRTWPPGSSRAAPQRGSGVNKTAASLVIWRSDPREVLPLFRALEAQRPGLGRLEILVNEDPCGIQEAALTELLKYEGVALQWRVRSVASNTGYAGGHGFLLRALFEDGFDSVLVVNPDLLPSPTAVAQLAAAQAPTLSLRGPFLLTAAPGSMRPEGTIDSAGIRWTRTGRHLDARQGQPIADLPIHPYRVAGVSGACLYVTREAYTRVVESTGEFFDEDFVAYREDAELGLRAARVGVSSWIVPAAQVLHVRGVRGTRRRGVSQHINRLGVRNRLLLRFKHGANRPGVTVASTLRDLLVVVAAMTVERSSWSGVVDAWRLRGRMREKDLRIRLAETDAPMPRFRLGGLKHG